MIDLHIHSLLSDGELLPAEVVQRAKVKGIKVVAITDHIDLSNAEPLLKELTYCCRRLDEIDNQIKVVCGVELTHIPPTLLKELVEFSRGMGAQLILAHGETIVEPVEAGTNYHAIKAGIDILAHPGLITEEDVILARENRVYLEISARAGHALTNGHVVRLASKFEVPIIFGTDAHKKDEILSPSLIEKVIKGAGILEPKLVMTAAEALLSRCIR